MADTSSNITVGGGTGGIGARLDDMRTEAKVLGSVTAVLLEKAQAAVGIATDGDLLESAVLSPVTAAVAEEKIAMATGKLVLYATESGVTAAFLEGAVVAYETVDKALAELADIGANVVMFGVGVAAVPLAIGGGLLVLADVAGTYVAGYGGELINAAIKGTEKTLHDPRALVDPLGVFAQNTVDAYDPDRAQDATSEMLAAQLQALNELAGNSGLVDLIAKGAPGLLAGLTVSAAVVLGVAGTLVGGPGGGAAAVGALPSFLTKLTGVAWPPKNYEQAVQAIVGAGNRGGALQDGRKLTEKDLFTPPGITREPVVEPHNTEELLAGSAQIDKYDSLNGDENAFSRIRITTVPGNPPHYIVQIPSTQSWDLTAGATPNDVTADTQAMMAHQTALSSAVDAAMQKAGIRSTDPVMLEGFSLGGITAGQMAADPTLHYNITHVVTAGSPIANFDIPPTTKVLAYEFNQDPVAQLDGQGNPGSANFTTVKADAPSLPSEHGVAPGIASTHNADRYAQLAAEAGVTGNPSINDFNSSANGFFGGSGQTVDYGAQR